jgi:hypothetical protein
MKHETMGNSGLGGPRSVLLTAIIAGLLVAPGLARIIQAARSENASSSITEEELENRNQSSIAGLFGEFRASMSDIMFVKTERYLHSGVGYEKHLDYSKMAESGEVEHEERDGDHDHAHVVRTLIKTPGEDWRTFIGDLEREVKPWHDPKQHVKHTSGEELLPWYWLAVTANPHNVRAYRIGAYWLMTKGIENGLEEALRFTEDGIRNNPKAFALLLMKGRVLHQMKRDGEALEAFVRGSDMAKAARPEGGFPSENAADLRENDFRALMRFRVFFLEMSNRNEDALRIIEEFNGLAPDDRTLDLVKERIESKISIGS